MADEVRIIAPETRDATIARAVNAPDTVFPDEAQIELWEPFKDAFKLPSWCDQERYEYAWLDPSDRLRAFDVALEEGYWNIVKRINHPSAPSSDFKAHGAVERGGQVLVFRPAGLGHRLRELPVQRHLQVAQDKKAGQEAEFYELTYAEGKAAGTDGKQVFAQEEPGIKDSETAATSLKPK